MSLHASYLVSGAVVVGLLLFCALVAWLTRK